MEGCSGHLVHLVNSASKLRNELLPFKSCHRVLIKFNSPSSVYITPPVAAASFVTSRRRSLVAGLVPGIAGVVPGLVPAELYRHPPLF